MNKPFSNINVRTYNIIRFIQLALPGCQFISILSSVFWSKNASTEFATTSINFHSHTMHPDIIKSFIYPTECTTRLFYINSLNAELNPICHLLALSGACPILHISRIRVKTYIKMLLHVSVNKPSSRSLLPCFAKVMIIKIVS